MITTKLNETQFATLQRVFSCEGLTFNEVSALTDGEQDALATLAALSMVQWRKDNRVVVVTERGALVARNDW